MNEVAYKYAGLLVVFVFGLMAASIAANAQQADPAAVELIENLSLRESAVPIRDHPRWAKPRMVVVTYRETPGVSEAEFLAGIGAVVHFIWLVKADLREPMIYAVVLAALLSTRVPWRRITRR